MKRITLTAIFTALLAIGIVATAPAVNIYITATADNLQAMWYRDGDDAQQLAMPADPDNSLKDWRTPDIFGVDLEFCEVFEIIFMVVNDDNDAGYRAPSDSNPGGFLAEIALQGLDQSDSSLSNALSDATWEVARIDKPDAFDINDSTTWAYIPPDGWDSTAIAWTAATEWAYNGGNYVAGNPKAGDPGFSATDSGIWATVNGISTDAKWIWTYENFNMANAPDQNDSVFIKVTVHPTPEPGTLLLLGSGLAGLGGFARLKLRRRKKV